MHEQLHTPSQGLLQPKESWIAAPEACDAPKAPGAGGRSALRSEEALKPKGAPCPKEVADGDACGPGDDCPNPNDPKPES